MDSAHIYKKDLSVAQSEELLELITKRAGGNVTYDERGVTTVYKLPSGESFPFRTGLDVYAYANKHAFDLFEIPASSTKLDGLADIQTHQSVMEAISNSISEGPKTLMGYGDLAQNIADKIAELKLSVAGNVDLLSVLKDSFKYQKIEELARDARVFQFDPKKNLALTTAIHRAIECMGVQFFDEAKHSRAKKHLPESMAPTQGGGSIISASDKVASTILSLGKTAFENKLSYREFVKYVHRSMYSRNVALSLENEKEHGIAYPAKILSAGPTVSLMRTYSAIIKGDFDRARGEIDALSYHADELSKTYALKNETPNDTALARQALLTEKIFMAKAERASHIELDEKSHIVELFRSGFQEMSPGKDVLIRHDFANAMLASSILSDDDAMRSSALDKLEALVENIPKQLEIEISLREQKNAFEKRLDNATHKLVNSFKEVRDIVPDLVSREWREWDKVFPRGTLPFGQSVEKSDESLSEMQHDVALKMYNEGANRIRKSLPPVVDKLAKYAVTDKEWQGVLEASRSPSTFDSELSASSKFDLGVEQVVTSSLLNYFIDNVAPNISEVVPDLTAKESVEVEIKQSSQSTFLDEPSDEQNRNESTPTLQDDVLVSEPGPIQNDLLVTEPKPAQKDVLVMKPQHSHEDAIAPDIEVESTLSSKVPDPSSSNVPHIAHEPLSTPNEVISNVGPDRELLEQLYERAIQYTMKGDELVLPDEFEWIQKRSEKVWGASDVKDVDESQVRNVIEQYQTEFAPVLLTKNRNKVNEWYLSSVYYSLKTDQINATVDEISSLVNDKDKQAILNRAVNSMTSGVFDTNGEIPLHIPEVRLAQLGNALLETKSHIQSFKPKELGVYIDSLNDALDTRDALANHFIDMISQKPESKGSIEAHWEKAFGQGVRPLVVEAIVTGNQMMEPFIDKKAAIELMLGANMTPQHPALEVYVSQDANFEEIAAKVTSQKPSALPPASKPEVAHDNKLEQESLKLRA